MTRRVRPRVLGVVLSLVACTRTPTSTSTPVPAPVVLATPQDAVAGAPATPATAPPEPPAPAEPEQRVTVVATDLPAGAVIAWPTDGGQWSGGAVLFDDELGQLRVAVGKALTKRGIAVVPIATLEAVEASAATGVLALEKDQRCATGLSRDDVHARYLADRPRVTVEASCFDACRLEVHVEAPGQDPVTLTSEDVAKPERIASWIAAASRLQDMAFGYGGLGLGGGSIANDVEFDAPRWIGPWRAPPTAEQFDLVEPAAQACAHGDASLDLRYVLRAQIAANGSVERCAVSEASDLASTRERACLCEHVQQMRFERHKANRRLRVDVVDRGVRGAGAPGITAMQPGTDPWVSRIVVSPVFERCGVQLPVPPNIDAVLSMKVDASGVVDDARIDGNITTTTDMRWAQCVVGEIGAVRMPCAPPGIDRLRVRLGATP